MNDDDTFDVDALRINPDDPTLKPRMAKAKKAKWRREFVSVPWAWVDRLKPAIRGSTYRLALLLNYEFWKNGRRPIRLSNAMLVGDGISRRSKDRALRELEQFGLVKVERRARKSPVVTLLLVGQNPKDG